MSPEAVFSILFQEIGDKILSEDICLRITALNPGDIFFFILSEGIKHYFSSKVSSRYLPILSLLVANVENCLSHISLNLANTFRFMDS